MLGPEILAIPRLGAIGFHPSLLPRNRGSYPLWWTLRRGDRSTGLTLFHLTADVDAGPIIEQQAIDVDRRDTFATLYERVAALLPGMLDRVLDATDRAGAVPAGAPQDEARATYVGRPGAMARALAKSWWAIRSRASGLPR
jgi:methionyl-tRNA formyltransferase